MHHQLNEPAGIRRLLFVFFPGCWLVATFPALTGIARGHLFYRERLLQCQWLAPFFPDEDQAMPPQDNAAIKRSFGNLFLLHGN